MGKIVKLLVVNVLIFILCLALLEGASRLFVTDNENHALFNDQTLRTRGRSFIEIHKERGFSLKKGFKNKLYSINSDGFRGEELPSNLANKKVILSLGESTTFGWGVNNKQTYPYYLSKQLSKQLSKKSIQLINAGVPSYTSSQVLLYLKEIINKKILNPDIVLINILWNDIWYSSIKNWHANMLVYQKPPRWIEFLDRYSTLFHLIITRKNAQKSENVFNANALAKYQENLIEMIKLCKQNKIAVVFVNPPFDAEHMNEKGLTEFKIHYSKDFLISTARLYQKKMEQIFLTHDVKHIQHQLDLRFLQQHSLFLDALHPTAQGNFLMAKDIYKQLIEFDIL